MAKFLNQKNQRKVPFHPNDRADNICNDGICDFFSLINTLSPFQTNGKMSGTFITRDRLNQPGRGTSQLSDSILWKDALIHSQAE